MEEQKNERGAREWRNRRKRDEKKMEEMKKEKGAGEWRK